MTPTLKRYGLVGLILVVLTVVFFVALVVAPPMGERALAGSDRFVFGLAFFLGLLVFYLLSDELAVHLVTKLYALPREEAAGLVERIFFGLPDVPPFDPVLNVKEGYVDPDGPAVMRKVGGPGFLKVAYDSAAVTERGGRLVRILGPGWHKLHAFERVWDVVDLRPQHRVVTTKAVTRDGIPITCTVDLVFRIADDGSEPSLDRPYPFSEEAVFTASTIQRVRERTGKDRIIPWANRIASGLVDGTVRDALERLTLDELLFLDEQEEPPLAALGARLQENIRQNAASLGVHIESLRLAPVQPEEEAISRQWLEAWLAEWQRYIAGRRAQGEAEQLEAVELARIQVLVELITGMQQAIQNLDRKGMEVPPTFIVLRFLEAMRSLTVGDPLLRSTMPQQTEALLHLLESLRQQLPPPGSGEGTTASGQNWPALPPL